MELSEFMDWVARRNAGEVEFLQAVEEVAEYVVPFVNEHPQYLEARILERMTEPDRIVTFRVCWEDDRGGVHINRGYRVQFSKAIGPYKGGLRFDPSVNLSVLKFLGFEQTFKNALTTLALGSAKGGSNFDPKGKSDREVMRFCHSYMTELFRHIGSLTDVPAGDIGVGSREIGYLFGQYKRLSNQFAGALTGKAIGFGGSQIRTEATGYGAVYFAQEMLSTRQDGLEGAICTVSGSGNVAQYAAEKLIELGAKVVTISDRHGFVHDPEGMTPDKLRFLMDLKNVRRGGLDEYALAFGCEYFRGERPWRVPCDMAFPCATQNEIDEDDARTLLANGCRLVSEGANMPTVLAGAKRFIQAGILYGPAKAANAGGVAVSGLEMSQNAMRQTLQRDEIDRQLRSIMRKVHDQCVRYGAEDDHVDYLKGANLAGFVTVADATLAYGVM
jgi:glutamate dehydrogenase (NADP+)